MIQRILHTIKKTAGDEGTQVSISLANGFDGAGFVSGLEENDNIYFYDGHLLRNWRDGVQNTLSIEHALRSINITDYFGGETAYPAITLNSDPLPTDLTVKIANDVEFTTPYSCDPNFNEIITGIGYVTNLGEGDRIVCHSSPEYYFDSEGLGVQDDENDIVIADNTTGQTDKVYVDGDQYYINGGYNTIKTTGATYVNIIDSSTNTITTGGKDDIFEIGGGVNNIKGDAGDDTYIFKALEDGENTLITDSKGNDVYNFTEVDSFDGLAIITDKNGTNTIMLADSVLKLFCDGTFKYNKENNTGTFTFGKNVAFVEEVTTDVTNGIQMTGKTVDKLKIECADNSLYNLDELKGAVTAWFTEQAMGGAIYKSVEAVFNSGDDIAINSLLNVYNQVPPNA